MWNDPQFVEAARNVAQQTIAKKLNFEQSVDEIGLLFLSRKFKAKERSHLRNTLEGALRKFSDSREQAAALLSVGESRLAPNVAPVKLAAWTVVTSQIMNLDEALTH
jgi:hypothetical protein